ncbi:MAG: leucyl aminopeptidase, partial [Pseudomonadales bacterium]|nr:leucyl aminopeptidase [Pseudomonadales bacterium]
MEYKITKAAPEQQAAGMLVLGLLPKLQPSAAIKRLPPQTQEWIGAILKQGDLPDKAGKSLLLHQVPGLKAERLLLLAQGEKAQISARDFLSIIRSVIGKAKATTAKSLLWSLDGLEVAGHDQAWMVRQIILGAETARYQYQATKGSNKPDDKQKLKKITLQRSDLISPSQCEQLINQSSAMAHGVALARELGNLPPNLCTPSYLADQAKQLAQAHDALSLKVLNAKEMKALGMGALLAVAAGSAQPPKLIILEYRGATEDSAPHVLVGKGITFDSGGISLKPGAAMDEMKFD